MEATNRPRRGLGVLAAAVSCCLLFVALVTPSRAGASTGALTPDGCIEDGVIPGADDCAEYANRLSSADDVAVGPDGRTVVAVAGMGSAGGHLSSYFRTANGTLANFGCFADDDAINDPCTKVTALAGAGAIAHSPDGKSVYVASGTDDAIVIFDRDPANGGSLDPAGCIDDNDFATDPNQGPETCAQTADGLDGATGVAVSPDGNTVYATSDHDGAVAIFGRNLNGSLTPLGCWDDNDTGADAGCTHTTNGLGRPWDVAVSPDGKSVYVASLADDAVVHLHRDTTTGLLTAAECYDDNDFATDPNQGPDTCLLAGETDGLNGARSVAVSPDNASVHVAAGGDDSVVSFTRDPADGDLTPAGCRSDNDTGTDCPVATRVDGLDLARSVAVSPDSLSVYVASEGDDAVARFDRAGNGSLVMQGCIDDNDTATDPTQGEDTCAQSTNGLHVTRGVAVSPDGRAVFAVGAFDRALALFTREDSTPPQTTIVSGPLDGTILDAPQTFTFVSSEPLSTFACGFFGVFPDTCTSPFTLSASSHPPIPATPGTYEFDIFAIDPSGNVDPTPANRSLILPEPPPPPPADTTPPVDSQPPPSPPPTGTAPESVQRKCKKKRKKSRAAAAKKKKCKKKGKRRRS